MLSQNGESTRSSHIWSDCGNARPLAARKKPKVALMACIRKLLSMPNAVIRHRTPWSLEIVAASRSYPSLSSSSDHWFELLRLALSIKTGMVTESVILRKLAAYPRQNGLALALREPGKLERTFFTLQWLQDPELRRRSHVGLNKGEQQHVLRCAVFFPAWRNPRPLL
jgi:TnpA family transposase